MPLIISEPAEIHDEKTLMGNQAGQKAVRDHNGRARHKGDAQRSDHHAERLTFLIGEKDLIYGEQDSGNQCCPNEPGLRKIQIQNQKNDAPVEPFFHEGAQQWHQGRH